jgi:hypothetical protein
MGAVRASRQVRASTQYVKRYPLSLTIGGVSYVCMLVCVCVCVSYKGAAATEEGQHRESMRVRFHCCQQGTRVFRFSHTSQSPPQKDRPNERHMSGYGSILKSSLFLDRVYVDMLTSILAWCQQ